MLTHAAIRRLRSLREKKHREELGLFVVEGEKVVAELVAAKFPFVEIYATPAWTAPATVASNGADDNQRGAPSRGCQLIVDNLQNLSPPRPTPVLISEADMARASHYPTPSSVLAVGKIAREPLAPGTLDHGLTLALDGVQDAGNVGTLLRIADWFGFDRVVLSPDCADRFNQKVINASMGSFARVRAHTVDLAAAFAATETPILGCALAGENIHALAPVRDAIVVIGSEGHGLSAAVQKRVTHYVTVPKYGAAESLNAAVAAAIVCDNLRRTRP